MFELFQIISIVIIIMLQIIYGLTMNGWLFVVWCAGAITSHLVPYITKWIDSGKTLPYDTKYLKSLFSTILAGALANIVLFFFWTPPDVAFPFLLFFAFFAAMGVDGRVMARLVKKGIVLSKIFRRFRGEPVTITQEDLDTLTEPLTDEEETVSDDAEEPAGVKEAQELLGQENYEPEITTTDKTTTEEEPSLESEPSHTDNFDYDHMDD